MNLAGYRAEEGLWPGMTVAERDFWLDVEDSEFDDWVDNDSATEVSFVKVPDDDLDW